MSQDRYQNDLNEFDDVDSENIELDNFDTIDFEGDLNFDDIGSIGDMSDLGDIGEIENIGDLGEIGEIGDQGNNFDFVTHFRNIYSQIASKDI